MPSAQCCLVGEAVGASYSAVPISNYGAMNRLLAAGALAAFIAAMIVIALASLDSGDGGTHAVTTVVSTRTLGRTQPTTTAPKPPSRIALVAVGPYDPPPGDGTENDAQVPNAVDGDATTFWSTEHYTHGFFKPGVGIVLDAGRKRPIARVVVATDEPGSRAEIQLADRPTGPYRVVSANQALEGTTAFVLKRGSSGRYVLVWLTALPSSTGEGHVNEVRALAR
jgi:eukaryotic-like serine/threonine-protein kinase